MNDRTSTREPWAEDALTESLQALQNTAGLGADIGRLMILESRLALNSLGRIFLLALLCIPLLLFAWLGLTLLPAVFLYSYIPSPGLCVAVFFSLQVLALYAIVRAIQVYARNLRFPLSREQVKVFLDRGPDGS